MKQPQHTAGPAFAEARDKIAFYERQLEGPEKQRYDEFRKQQQKERDEQKEKTDQAKAALDEARKNPGKAELNYNTPGNVRAPQNRLLGKQAMDERKKLIDLALAQKKDKLHLLEKMNKERLATKKESRQQTRGENEQQPDKKSTFRENAHDATRRKTALSFERASRATPSKDAALARAFEKAREREVQDKNEHNKSNDHNNTRKM